MAFTSLISGVFPGWLAKISIYIYIHTHTQQNMILFLGDQMDGVYYEQGLHGESQKDTDSC